jgi:hypothetical protein
MNRHACHHQRLRPARPGPRQGRGKGFHQRRSSQKYLKFYRYPFALSVGAQRRSRRAAWRPEAWRWTSTPRLAKSGEPLRSVRTDDAEPKVAEGPSASD